MARNVVDEPGEEIVANAKISRDAKRGPFARLSLFIKQVIAELKKVVTPTRKELLSYTGVVLVFVVIMMTIVSAYDWVFALVVTYVFGTPGA
ncbi:MAG: preprotein translocase subunit SecE [Cryobacterium sp.]